MVIPENIIIVVGIVLIVSIMLNAYLIGMLAYHESKKDNERSNNA